MRFPIGLRSVVSRCYPTAVVLTVCLFMGLSVLASGHFALHSVSARETIEQAPESQTTTRIRVAEGEYKAIGENGIGFSDSVVYGFGESWTLWRLQDGTFEVNGTRSYRSPSDEVHMDAFSVHLSSNLSVLALKEYRKLRWRLDSGPLNCDFPPGRIKCASNAKVASQNVTLDLPVENPAGFMWPISAFSLSSITRSASRDLKGATPVELVEVEEPSMTDPIFATILSGHLKYLGHEQLSLADGKWDADKFELKVAIHPPFYLYTSPEGLLLSCFPENKGKVFYDEGLVLLKFQQWEKF